MSSSSDSSNSNSQSPKASDILRKVSKAAYTAYYESGAAAVVNDAVVSATKSATKAVTDAATKVGNSIEKYNRSLDETNARNARKRANAPNWLNENED